MTTMCSQDPATGPYQEDTKTWHFATPTIFCAQEEYVNWN